MPASESAPSKPKTKAAATETKKAAAQDAPAPPPNEKGGGGGKKGGKNNKLECDGADEGKIMVAEARAAALEAARLASRGIILRDGVDSVLLDDRKQKQVQKQKKRRGKRLMGKGGGSSKGPGLESVDEGDDDDDGESGTARTGSTTPRTAASTPSNHANNANGDDGAKAGKQEEQATPTKKKKPFAFLGRKNKKRRYESVNVTAGPPGDGDPRDSHASSNGDDDEPHSHTIDPAKKRRELEKKPHSNLKKQSSSSSAPQTDPRRAKRVAPWMCSLCGAAFSTLEGADVHESKCVRDACDRRHFFAPEGTGGTFKVDLTTNKSSSPTTRRRRRLSSAIIKSFSSDSADSDRSAGGGASTSTAMVVREPDRVPLGNGVRRLLVLTDEAMLKVVSLSGRYMFTPREVDAERELALLVRDRSYYDHMARRAELRRRYHGRRATTLRNLPIGSNSGVLQTVQNRLADAYELIKEGENKSQTTDRYSSQGKKGGEKSEDITHDDRTLYLNVLVKNSVQVVNSELQRMAKLRWQAQQSGADPNNPFAQFRQQAQDYVVKLASLALESDFKPRRIAIQMSNDFYRLLVPEMRRRGVTIETEIEYRVGAFFVLAINVISINWVRFIEFTHFDVKRRREAEKLNQLGPSEAAVADQQQAVGSAGGESKPGKKKKKFKLSNFYPTQLFPSMYDAMAHVLYLLYNVHWIISVPFCTVWYYVFLRRTTHIFIVQSVTDDLYTYAENKGMEMLMEVRTTYDQASFMLAVLRQMRAEERQQKKDQEMEAEEGGKPLLGDLLGPHIKDDKAPASPPADWAPPENLENVCLEIDVPVGFRRLRWALMRSDSEFMRNAVMVTEDKLENIQIGKWSEYDEYIGMPNLPPDVDQSKFVGVEREQSYLMPASAMVKANTAYETVIITEYNDHCFAFKKKTSTPEVPFGSSFFTWTQIVVYNEGKENCRLLCSSGSEFPTSRPMVARQIESGIRSGTTEGFVRFGETICRYA